MGVTKALAMLLMVVFAASLAAENSNDSIFIEDMSVNDVMLFGNTLYENADFKQAAEAYEHILSRGYVSSNLYYNLGNAYFKLRKLGLAILNYERALRLSPNDEDIQFNLTYARSSTIDDIQSTGSIWFKDITHAYLKLFSANGWAWMSLLFISLSVIFWLLFLSNRIIGSATVLVFVATLFLSVVSVLSSFGRKAYDEQRFAILLEQEITVKSAPSLKGEDMFIIHEGTKMELLDVYQEWLKIRLENGNVGWLLESFVEEI